MTTPLSADPEYLYLNIYEHKDGFTISHYHATRDDADEAAKDRDDRVSCIRVEFRKNQFDPDDSFLLNINEFRDYYTLSQELYKDRQCADGALTRSSRRIACVRVPLAKGRFDA